MTQIAAVVSRAYASNESSEIGTLSGYDAETRLLRLKTDRGVDDFVLADKASVHLGPRVLPATEIGSHVGLRAKVRFTRAGNQRLANSVMLSPAG